MTDTPKSNILPMPDDPQPKGKRTERPREAICGLPLHTEDQSCICTSALFRIVEIDGKTSYICHACHREHKGLEAMKWVEL